jgi:S-adenosylmethionine:tRNA ribosyltransferase-isomerase
MNQGPRLLVLDGDDASIQTFPVHDLPRLFHPGDVLVVNDAATLPASLFAETSAHAHVEVRLLAQRGDDPREWSAVLFGEGDFHTPTEHRPAPPEVAPGDRFRIGDGFVARVDAVSPLSRRLLNVRFLCEPAAFWHLLYAYGHPVQYAHTTEPYELWDVQTPYAARPWAAEMPSAGYHLGTSILRGLEQKGVGVHALTHAAGLSATGDTALDERLPLAERFDIPSTTVRAVGAARREGHRVVAAGTTVLRALEGCQVNHDGRLVDGPGLTDLRIGPEFRLRIANGLLTGLHERTSSHFRLLQALADEPILEKGYRYADEIGLRGHELGDLSLVWAKHHSPRVLGASV